MYDLIGDIHGHCATLQKLLTQLGYASVSGVWQHPVRKVIFVGDYIDRGPQIKQTLALVKAMTDSGNAIALMGNHEYNAVAFATPDGKGDYLRPHNATHIKQHAATLDEFTNHESLWQEYLQWFKTLPLFLDLGNLRAVHACWDAEHITWLKENKHYTLSNDLLHQAHKKGSRANTVIEETLKGKEFNIPEKYVWYDKDGHARTANRIKWWEQSIGSNYGKFLFSCPAEMSSERVAHIPSFKVYPTDAPPVFIGHYWLDDLVPALQSVNVVCLDYSVAKAGYLVAYRWNGEAVAEQANFVVQHN